MHQFVVYLVLFFVSLLTLDSSTTWANQSLSSKGKVRVRSEQHDFHQLRNERSAYSLLQLEWQLNYQADKRTAVFFEPKFAKTMGAPAGTSGATADEAFGVHQGYFSHKIFNNLSLVAGRMEMVYGDQVVLGGVNWGNVGRAFDGFKFEINRENAKLDVFSMKITENHDTTVLHEQDKDLHGIYYSRDFYGPVSILDIYYLKLADLNRSNNLDVDMAINTYGLRLKGDWKRIDYRLETTTQSGQLSGADLEDAQQLDFELGFRFKSKNPFRISVESFQAGKNYQPLYPSKHKWLGYMDLFDRSNIQGEVIKMQWKRKWVTFFLDHHLLRRTDTQTAVGNFGTTGSSANIGSETDLTLKFSSSKSMDWHFGYSSFSPGSYLTENGFDKNSSFVYLQASAHF